MDKMLLRLAVSLRWLAVLWLVGSTLYLTLWDNVRLSTVETMLAGLATVLVPAAVVFGLSCLLDRLGRKVQDGTESARVRDPKRT
jgi:uncharacterized membrane protein YfhO